MKEGDTYDAANTNAEVDVLVTSVNGLTFADNVRPRSLGGQHLPSILDNDDGVDRNRGDGMDVGTSYLDWPASAAFDQYSNALSPAPRLGNPVDIQVFVASPVGAGAGVGWRVVSSSASISDSCSVVWGAGGTDWADYDSLLVSASICIGHENRIGVIAQDETFDSWKHCFALAFAIEDTAGNRYCVPRTIRCFQGRSSVGERVALTALLNSADLTAAAAEHGGSADARRVSLIFGRFIPDDNSAGNLNGIGHIELGPFNISQMPMKHGIIS